MTSTSSFRRPRYIVCLMLGSMLVIGSGAFGQNALDAGGGGDALDANLGAGPNAGRRNSTRVEENFRNRNLVITGNVAGGRGFRGSVGYSAEDDFRGTLGSNDLFDFRAGSAFSDPQYLRAGSTMEQLRYGQGLGLVEYRRSGSAIETPRNVSSSTALTESARSGFRVEQIPDVRLRADRLTQASMSRTAQDVAGEPRVVGVAYDEQGQTLVVDASPLRGLSLQPMNEYVQSIGLTSLDAARLREDKMIGRGDTPRLGAPFESRFEGSRPTDVKLDTAATPDRVQGPAQESFQAVLEKIAERYAGLEGEVNVDPKVLRALDDEYKQLREKLSNGQQRSSRNVKPADGRRKMDGEAPLRGTRDDMPPKRKPDQASEPSGAEGDAKPGESGTQPERAEIAPTDEPRTAADFGVILRHGQRIDRFSTDGEDRFNEILRNAEKMMHDGQYFDAERRFSHALRFTPDHPFAAAGQGHAQIGAGLYLSASLTLQRMFTRTPEMIDVTYGEAVLPTRDLMRKAADEAKSHLKDAEDSRAFAFLLAYIGKQLGDRAMIDEGLGAMLALDPEDELAKLLQAVWK